jgi:hypothetical protein
MVYRDPPQPDITPSSTGNLCFFPTVTVQTMGKLDNTPHAVPTVRLASVVKSTHELQQHVLTGATVLNVSKPFTA